MYYSFNPENFNESVEKTLLEQKVDRLVTPQNSEYYYLKELKFEDLSFPSEYSYKFGMGINYKASVNYRSKKEPGVTKTGTFNSYVLAVRFEESPGVSKIPAKIYEQYKPIFSSKDAEIHADSIDESICRIAKTKIKAKVRFAGDPIEREDMDEVVITEKSDSTMPTSPFEYLVWSPIIVKATKKRIGYAIITNKKGVEYFFSPDNSKKGLDKSYKPVPIAPVAPTEKPSVKPSPKKPKNKVSAGDTMVNILSQSILAVIVAAVLLIIEFVGVLIVGNVADFGSGSVFGKGFILKKSPGLYQITTENYEDYLVLTSLANGNTRTRVKEGEERTYVMHSTSSSMSAYHLFEVSPRSSSYSVFDIGENNSLETTGSYRAAFDVELPKYVVSDLYIKFEVSYSYEGNVETMIVEKTVDEYGNFHQTAGVLVDFPDYVRGSYTGQYVSNSKGDTYTQTTYYPDIDYWTVRVIEVSGTAEVMEVDR